MASPFPPGPLSARRDRLRSTRLAAALAVAILIGACSGEATETTTTTPARSTTTSTLPPDPAVDGPVFRVGLLSEVTTTNWWAALDTENTAENQAVLANTKSSLFTLSRPGFALVPALAATSSPAVVTQQGSVWVAEQTMRDDVTWSDGEPVTAEDLVLYFDAVREFDLGGAHAANFPSDVADVSAVDEHTVRIEFTADPSLTTWETGVAMAPLIPSHFWAARIDDARAAADAERLAISDEEAAAAVSASSLTDADPGNDVTPEEVDSVQISAFRGRAAAAAGRDHLYSIESPAEPSSGSLTFESWDGDTVSTRSNPVFYARGTETTVYSDGSVRVASPNLGDQVYGGDASGAVEAHQVVGPFVSEVRWQSYTEESEAYDALASGELDFVYDVDGLDLPTYNRFAGQGRLGLSLSTADGFRFLAFNLRKPPMSDPVFRRAVATVIDKELVASSLFNGTLSPAYTIVHPALTTFYDADVNRPGWSGDRPMSEPERFQAAIAMLSEAGYTWDVEPEVVYDTEGNFVDVTPGSGLEMPNGVDVPELTIVAAPGSGDDPVRSTYALWIAQWINDLGVNVTTQPTDLDSVVETVIQPDSFEDTLSWDLHVLGWGSPNLALPGLTLVALFDSRNTVESGGLNITGYSSADFDAAADSFVASGTLEEAANWTKQMEQIIAQDLPYVTLYRPSVIEAFGSQVQFPVDAIIGGHAAAARAWPESVRIDG